jgi:arylsulfatase B
MDPNELTLAEIFRANGYHTGMFGKWHLGDCYPCRPQDQGFDHVVYHGGGGVGQTPDWWGNDYFDDTYWKNGDLYPTQGYCTDVWFREAVDYIKQVKEEPFFVYLSTNAPHGPYRVDPKYSEPYGTDAAAKFMGMITNIDENVGKLVAYLREQGLEENTLFLFTTDNGTSEAKGVGFNAGMRGQKGSQYDGGHRVPLYWHWPKGNLTGGRDVSQLAAHIDIRPTLVELLGLQEPSGPVGDGASLVPALRGDDAVLRDRTMFVHSQRILHPAKGRMCSVMTDRWRLVDRHELYDMHADPGQSRDIASEHPEVVADLVEAYDGWWESLQPAIACDIHYQLGTPHEPRTRLTTHDWLMEQSVAWDHSHIRRDDATHDVPKSGPWAVEFTQPGKYEVMVSRWPEELQRAMGAVRAELTIGDQSWTHEVAPGEATTVFVVDIPAGKTRLQPALFDANRQAIGAYFAYVRILP